MKISSVAVQDEASPVELQTWLDNNPLVTINFVLNDGRMFFIFYT
jgi:hypothetical protein